MEVMQSDLLLENGNTVPERIPVSVFQLIMLMDMNVVPASTPAPDANQQQNAYIKNTIDAEIQPVAYTT